MDLAWLIGYCRRSVRVDELNYPIAYFILSCPFLVCKSLRSIELLYLNSEIAIHVREQKPPDRQLIDPRPQNPNSRLAHQHQTLEAAMETIKEKLGLGHKEEHEAARTVGLAFAGYVLLNASASNARFLRPRRPRRPRPPKELQASAHRQPASVRRRGKPKFTARR